MDSKNSDSDDEKSFLNSILKIDDASNLVHGENLNPTTTEHLKLFNPTFKKKKGPPKKVDIIDPQEFKNPQKAIESVVNSNMSHDLVPSLPKTKTNTIKDMIDKATDEIRKELIVSYDETIPDNEKNTFRSSVEVLLRELQFQEQFITPNIESFSLMPNKNKAKSQKLDLNNYQISSGEELSKEQLQSIEIKKAEIERAAKKRKLELDQEIEFSSLRKKVEFEKLQQERREHYSAELQKALEKQKEIDLEIQKKEEEEREAQKEREKVEKEKIQMQLNLDKQAIDAMNVGVTLIQHEEFAKKACDQHEIAEAYLTQKQEFEKEWKLKMEKVNELHYSVEEIKNIQEKIDISNQERIKAENEAKQSKIAKEIALKKLEIEKAKKFDAEEKKRKAQEYVKIIEEKKKKAQELFEKRKERYEFMKKEAIRIEEERKKAEAEKIKEEELALATRQEEEKRRNQELLEEQERVRQQIEMETNERLEKYKIYIQQKQREKEELQRKREQESISKLESKQNNNPSEFEIRKLGSDTPSSFHGLSANEITNILTVFNFQFYRDNYEDAKNLNIRETLKHYLTKGKDENRIISKKHAQFITGVPDFDILFYKNNNPDLKELTLRELCVHFITRGQGEGRYHKEDLGDETRSIATESTWDVNSVFTTEHNDWSQHRICIIYPYYEKPNSTKNQDNLAYFLKFGMNKRVWRKMNIKLLLMINGYQCEVDIPKQDNIIVWRKGYSNEEDGRDIGSFRKGIEYMENKYNKAFYDKFDYLFVLNSSATGPIADPKPDYHWLDPFIEKMEIENSVICSPVINFLRNTDAGGPGPRCQTYCSLIKMTQDVYTSLLFTPVSRSPKNTINFSCAGLLPTHATVLSVHKTTADVILFGEYGLTRVLLDQGFNISCLVYDNIDYHDPTTWNSFSDRIDRMEDYHPSFFDKAIFIKNNWIVGGVQDAYRDSLPVLFEGTVAKLYKSMGWIDCFSYYSKNIEYEYNFDHFPITGRYRVGGNQNDSDSALFAKWSSREEYFHLFGDAEGMIKFPKIQPNNKSVVIYTHIDRDNTVRDYVIQALRSLMVLGFDIFFNTTCQQIKNVTLPFEITTHTFKANTPINECHAIMFGKCFINKKFAKYNHILHIDSSYILPIHGIENMEKSLMMARETSDFWMLYDTRGIVYHNTCIEFSKKCIPFVKSFFIKYFDNEQKEFPPNFSKIIEVDLPQLLIRNGLTFHGLREYPNLTNLHSLFRSNECFAVQIPYIKKHVSHNKEMIRNPLLRFLVRYLNLEDFSLTLLGNQ